MSHALRAPQLCIVALMFAACREPAPAPLAWAEARATPVAAWPVMDAAAVAAWGASSGQPTVASLWARWCEPCLAEMPELPGLAQATGARWIAVATDDPAENPELTLAALTTSDRGAGVSHAFAPPGGPQAFLSAVGGHWTGMLPTHALFAADGGFLGVIEGTLDASSAAELSRRFAAGGPP